MLVITGVSNIDQRLKEVIKQATWMPSQVVGLMEHVKCMRRGIDLELAMLNSGRVRPVPRRVLVSHRWPVRQEDHCSYSSRGE